MHGGAPLLIICSVSTALLTCCRNGLAQGDRAWLTSCTASMGSCQARAAPAGMSLSYFAYLLANFEVLFCQGLGRSKCITRARSHGEVGAFHVQVEENQTPYLLYYSSHTSNSMNTLNLHKCHHPCRLITMFLWSKAIIPSLLLLCISIHVLYIAKGIIYVYIHILAQGCIHCL